MMWVQSQLFMLVNDLAKDGYICPPTKVKVLSFRVPCKHKLVEFSDVKIFETKDDKVTVLSIERETNLNI